MTLPLCAKIDSDDTQTNAALVSDRWREIGELIDFGGDVAGAHNPDMMGVISPSNRVDHAIKIAGSIQWSGRLSRDPHVPPEVAMDAINSDLWKANADGTLFCSDAGFIILQPGTPVRVHLIGIDPQHRLAGYARSLIRSSIGLIWKSAYVAAGTYSDNESAKALYLSLGMKPYRTRKVYHK